MLFRLWRLEVSGRMKEWNSSTALSRFFSSRDPPLAFAFFCALAHARITKMTAQRWTLKQHHGYTSRT